MPDAPSHTLAVCSWSLRPTSPTDLLRSIRATGVHAVQIALDPIARGLWKEDETFRLLKQAGIRVVSAMLAPAGEDYSTLDTIRATGGVRPDSTWPANLKAAHQIADICARHAIRLCTFHTGHVPADNPERAIMLDRLKQMCLAFLSRGVGVAFETGQETPDDQARILADLHAAFGPGHWSVGLNFDPANIILYGVGDPIAAFDVLKPHVSQVHIKDATRTTRPGTWGQEVPAGTGDVPWATFLALVHTARPDIDLVIEREAGEQRIADVRTARTLLDAALPGLIDNSASVAAATTTSHAHA